MQFEGEVALITGAGPGIGRAVAVEFAAHDGKVVVAGVNTELQIALRKTATTTCCHLLNAATTAGAEVTTGPNPLQSV